ncbi:hypothetical protein CMI37_32300 [Candidatus Pacearchaeota archaeon]|nr:hypothetical protein [Candidatus Pacearchaeota archaeon]
MAHIFPKRRFSSDEAVDPEEINENFYPSLNEVQGKLNEHNFKAEAFGAETYGAGLDNDCVLSMHYTRQTVDHGFVHTVGEGGLVLGNTPTREPTDAFIIEQSQTWQDVDDMSITVTTDNCVAWIQASFQLCTVRDSTFSASSLFGGSGEDVWPHPGIQCALAVDGSVIPETITGSLEKSNDHTGEGLAHYANGVVVDTITSLAAGSHTLTLKARVANDPFYNTQISSLSASANSESLTMWIGSRTLIVLEMR